MKRFLISAAAAAMTLSAAAIQTAPEGLRACAPDGKAPRHAATPYADEWTTLGKGTYKEILFSNLYQKNPQTLEVTVEQNASDPTLYRIPNVYENMDFTGYNGLTYDAANVEPMVFHVFRDEFAYFDEFDTGVHISYSDALNDYRGEVRMLMQATDLLMQNDIETLIAYLPDGLCSVRKGNITLNASFYLNGKNWNNILGLVYVTGTTSDKLIRGNENGDFLVTLPDAAEYDPNEMWMDLGDALFTDVFTEALGGQPNSWKVPMQQSLEYPWLYRLVNPYAYRTAEIPGMKYDDDNNYYLNMEIQDYENASLVALDIFRTGLESDIYGKFNVGTQGAEFYNTQDDFLTYYSYYPGLFGVLQDGKISYTAQCAIEATLYTNFYAWFGVETDYTQYYPANSSGNFSIILPGHYEDDAVEAVEATEEAPAEYYNLQGMRVKNPERGQLVVKRTGHKSQIIKF